MPRLDHPPEPAAVADAAKAGDAVAEQVVTLLARAIQRHHAYPGNSPLCEEAIAACHRGFASLRTRETITLRQVPGRLLLDDQVLQTAALAGAELARRFRRAGVASVTVDREVTPRELARFCREIVRRDVLAGTDEPLGDALAQQGVEKIQVAVVQQPAVLEVGSPDPARLVLMDRERGRRERAALVGAATHLYPPGKGWVRVDPSSSLGHASLLDLVLLVEDPAALATMLVRLSEDEPPASPEEALAEKVEEIAGLIGAMDPALAERLLTRLARSILSLSSERRQQLLRDSVLPGLLEGRAGGAVLRHFPDVELADALTLLLDLHVAAPEMLSAAIERLELPAEREDRLRPLLDQRRRQRRTGAEPDTSRPGAIDGFEDGRIRVDPGDGKDFRSFVAYDLAIDEATRQSFAAVADEVVTTDPLVARTRCIHDILLVETNPDTALELAGLAGRLLTELRDRGDVSELARWAGGLRDIAGRSADERPDVADELTRQLMALPTSALVLRFARQSDEAPGEGADLLGAFGPLVVPALLGALAEGDDRARRTLVKLIAPNAERLAAPLAATLDQAAPAAARYALQAIGAAASGLESHIAPLTRHDDQHLAREAFRTLARAGTPAALQVIVGALATPGRRVMLAEEAFWRLPSPIARTEARRLLADRGFALEHPEVARMVLGRLADQSPADAAAVADRLRSLRFHFWRPARMRLGMAAAAIANRRP